MSNTLLRAISLLVASSLITSATLAAGVDQSDNLSDQPVAGSWAQLDHVVFSRQALALPVATVRRHPLVLVVRLAATAFAIGAIYTALHVDWHGYLVATLVPLNPEALRKAQELIAKFRDWNPTRQVPYPSLDPQHGPYDDIAAVIAGRRPAAICHLEVSQVEQDPIGQALLEEARRHGLAVEPLAWVEAVGRPKQHFYVIGNPENVAEIIHLMTDISEFKRPYNDEAHRQLGQLLRIPPEAVEDFIGSEQRTFKDIVHTLRRLGFMDIKEVHTADPENASDDIFWIYSRWEDESGRFIVVRQGDGALFTIEKSIKLDAYDFVKHLRPINLETILADDVIDFPAGSPAEPTQLIHDARWNGKISDFVRRHRVAIITILAWTILAFMIWLFNGYRHDHVHERPYFFRSAS